MFVRIFSSRRVPIYCVNLVLVSSNDPFVMLGPLSVFFVILVTVFTCYFRAIKMMNIKCIVYSSIERLQRKRQLQYLVLHLDLRHLLLHQSVKWIHLGIQGLLCIGTQPWATYSGAGPEVNTLIVRLTEAKNI